MSRLLDIRLPAPDVINPPSFEEYRVGEVEVILKAEDGRTLLTETGEGITVPLFDAFVTSNNQVFFVRVFQ